MSGFFYTKELLFINEAYTLGTESQQPIQKIWIKKYFSCNYLFVLILLKLQVSTWKSMYVDNITVYFYEKTVRQSLWKLFEIYSFKIGCWDFVTKIIIQWLLHTAVLWLICRQRYSLARELHLHEVILTKNLTFIIAIYRTKFQFEIISRTMKKMWFLKFWWLLYSFYVLKNGKISQGFRHFANWNFVW